MFTKKLPAIMSLIFTLLTLAACGGNGAAQNGAPPIYSYLDEALENQQAAVPAPAPVPSPAAEPEPVAAEEQLTSTTEGVPAYITIRGEQFCTSLTELLVLSTGLTNEDIEPLKHMTNLTSLVLTTILCQPEILVERFPYVDLDTVITDISPLAGLTNLTHLNIERNSINDLSALANLTNLESLILCGFINDTAFDLEPISNLTSLKFLIIRSRQLDDSNIISLAGLTNLQMLDLSHNQINSLTPLANLINLESLDVSSNQISDLTPLADLPNLDFLEAGGNPITDWSPVAHIGQAGGRLNP